MNTTSNPTTTTMEEHRSTRQGGNVHHRQGEEGRTRCGKSTSKMWTSRLKSGSENKCWKCETR